MQASQYINPGLFGNAPSDYDMAAAESIDALRYAPPTYSPFANPAHIDDAFGYLANMYGPQLVQGAFGPDAFLMHQMPGQNVMDQHTAAQYQRGGAQVINAAHMAGNQEVAKKLLALQQIQTGGQPITQLDREHANTGAQVLNNPLFKQFAASTVGAETYEGFMFGRRGDPSAIAGAANRIGFYRADAATGDSRMSADSLRQFSQNVYQNMYGNDANLDEMRGFGAVASGEMMEHLFQKGQLPQALGALTPAERVKAMSAAKRDDKTMTRLAEQFGHDDLMARNFDYSRATEEEQKIMLADKMGDYKKRVSSTFEEIDKHVAKDPRAKSISEIEQLDGFSNAANAVDAQRTTKALKDYNGTIAAIREIFGDNGQANAPVQALIKSLEHLTGGSSSLAPGKLEKLVREVRMAARDSNTSLTELNKIVRDEQEMGVQMGLSRESGLERAHVNMLRSQSMHDSGAYEKMLPGKLQKAEADQVMADFSRRGDASAGGQSIAVLNRLVTENPDKYRGTKMEAAVKAYRNNQEEFEYKGKKHNLAQMVGEGGVGAMYQLARESGASDRMFRAYQMDRQGLQPFVQEGYAYKGQTYMHQRRLAQRQSAVLQGTMASDEFNKIKPMGMSDDEFAEQKKTIAPNLANRMLDVVMNETKDMSAEEVDSTLERRGKEELSKYFQSKDGGNLGKRAAEARAETYFNALYGADPETRKESMRTLYTESSAILQERTGVNIEGQKQIRNRSALADADARQKVNERRAERFDAAAMGTESTFSQRVGDELNNIASDNTRTRAESLKHVFNVVSEDKMLQKYAPDMQEGLVAAARMFNAATITPEQIQKLNEDAQKEPNGAAARELKKLAGFKPDEELTTEQQQTLYARAQMAAGNTAAGATPAQKEQNEAQRRRSTAIIKAYNTGKKEDVVAGARAMAEATLGPNADQKQIEAFAQSALDKDTTAFEKKMRGGVFGGGVSEAKQEEARAMSKALRASQEFGGLAAAGLDQTAQTVTEAQERPLAKTNEVTRDASQQTFEQLEQNYNKRAYAALKPADVTTEQFDARRKELMRKTADIASGVAINEMGNQVDDSPEDRAQFMSKRLKEEMIKHFESEGAVPARAEEKAKKHLQAVFGSGPEGVQQLNNVYATARSVAKDRGLETFRSKKTDMDDPASVNAQLEELSQRGKDRGWFASDMRFDNKEDQQRWEELQQRKKELETPTSSDGKMTDAQQKVVDEISKDPTADNLKSAMYDSEKRKQLLSLPDTAARDLFDKFSPEDQQKGIESLDGARTSMFLSKEERANVSRLHKTLADHQADKVMTGVKSAASAGSPAGLTSQNLEPKQAATLHAQGLQHLMTVLSGNTQATPGQPSQQEQLQLVTQQMEDIASRGKSGWFTNEIQLSKDDKEKYESLQQRKEEITSGDPLGTVTKQMEDIASRGKSGWFTNEIQLSKDDRKKYDALSQRRKELESGDPLGTVTKQMEDIASRGKSGWFTNEIQLSKDDRAQYDFLQQRRDEIKKTDPSSQVVKRGTTRSSASDAKMLPATTNDELMSVLGTLGGDLAAQERAGRRTGLLKPGEKTEQTTAMKAARFDSAGVTAIQQTQQAFAESDRATAGIVQQTAQQASRAQRGVQENEQGRDMQLTGTLVLKGLSEAVMQASGRHMEQTPDGTPVDMGGGTGSYYN
jgi:hypothetical protein